MKTCKKNYISCCAYKKDGKNYFELSRKPNKMGALTTRPDIRENAKKTGMLFIMEFVDAEI